MEAGFLIVWHFDVSTENRALLKLGEQSTLVTEAKMRCDETLLNFNLEIFYYQCLVVMTLRTIHFFANFHQSTMSHS